MFDFFQLDHSIQLPEEFMYLHANWVVLYVYTCALELTHNPKTNNSRNNFFIIKILSVV